MSRVSPGPTAVRDGPAATCLREPTGQCFHRPRSAERIARPHRERFLCERESALRHAAPKPNRSAANGTYISAKRAIWLRSSCEDGSVLAGRTRTSDHTLAHRITHQRPTANPTPMVMAKTAVVTSRSSDVGMYCTPTTIST